jgi:hypothetical protein
MAAFEVNCTTAEQVRQLNDFRALAPDASLDGSGSAQRVRAFKSP